VVGTEDALADGERALEEGTGGGRVAPGDKQGGEVMEAGSSEMMVGPKQALQAGQGALEERLGGILGLMLRLAPRVSAVGSG
jgi:hypothetical protein